MPQAGVLHVIGGHDRGKRFELTLAETSIGRGADQDLVLSDIAVSRHHVTVHLESGRYRIRDLGSGNGTLVNGKRVDSHVLADGDHIEIGQTVMRFEHLPSRSQAVPSALAAQVAPAEPSVAAGATPSDVVSPPARAVRAIPSTTGQRIGLPFELRLDTPRRRALVFGGMGLLSLVSLIIIFTRTVLARPQVVPSQAEELYGKGLRLFASGDWEQAKRRFAEVVVRVPDSADARRYQRLCETELKAAAALKNAESAFAEQKFSAGLKALDEIDGSSSAFDRAAKLRKENLPRAVAEEVEQAKRLATDDPEAARTHLTQALALDPDSEAAHALVARLKAGQPLATVAKEAPAEPPEPPPPVERKRKRERAEAPKSHEAPLGGMPLTAFNAYKVRDFVGAEKALRLMATQDAGKSAQHALDLANQIRQLRTTLDRAAGEESARPDLTARDYLDAKGLDERIGHGVHAAFFKAKLGKLQLTSAQLSFGQGKFDLAYAAAKDAQRMGADAGGIVRQLEAKAAELVQKGQALLKTSPAQAKQSWRMVLKMVAPGTPSYTRAYQLLNASSTGHRDEDED
jgi:tetratricopeptide (TPR) repeat protein